MTITLFLLGFATGWFYCALFSAGVRNDLETENSWLRRELDTTRDWIDDEAS